MEAQPDRVCDLCGTRAGRVDPWRFPADVARQRRRRARPTSRESPCRRPASSCSISHRFKHEVRQQRQRQVAQGTVAARSTAAPCQDAGQAVMPAPPRPTTAASAVSDSSLPQRSRRSAGEAGCPVPRRAEARGEGRPCLGRAEPVEKAAPPQKAAKPPDPDSRAKARHECAEKIGPRRRPGRPRGGGAKRARRLPRRRGHARREGARSRKPASRRGLIGPPRQAASAPTRPGGPSCSTISRTAGGSER